MDYHQSLLYLLHYCNYKALKTTAECVMLPPREGCYEACGILKELFGRPQEVMRSLLEGLMRGLHISSLDSGALSTLAVRIESCMIALEQINYTFDLSSLMTLKRVVVGRSYTLQYKGTERFERLTQSGREPRLSKLVELVHFTARIARIRFRQLES
ncbi:hypothetical protein FGIG_03470 [Fasciola gigantica]|uniref:Uncharacterized protein n=1 Tax=Fasciola gigantica TaxID=46835 RepID=A0A504YPV6_FASGI|nr:hypothetical protein FGIG_03470 [Fasciola gigantica]